MDEAEARKEIAKNPDRGFGGCDPEGMYELGEAVGYLAGVEAERERVRPLFDGMKTMANIFRTEGAGRFDKTAKAIDEVLAAYTTPQNDGKRDEGAV